MNSIEIVLSDGTEDRIFTKNQNDAVDFLKQYTKNKGATVRIDPGGAMVEFFPLVKKTAATQAIEHINNLFN